MGTHDDKLIRQETWDVFSRFNKDYLHVYLVRAVAVDLDAIFCLELSTKRSPYNRPLKRDCVSELGNKALQVP